MNRPYIVFALGCALALPVLPAAARNPWSDPQVVTSEPAANPATVIAETSDGTVVAIIRDTSGDLRRSSRAPGADWVPGGVFVEPDGYALTSVQSIAVTPDGAGWLAYRVDDNDSGVVRIVRWDDAGTSEVLGEIVDPSTAVGMSVDDESDVLLTYGRRGGSPLAAKYGNAADGFESLRIPSWTGAQRPHRWVLGEGDDVMLVSRVGKELRTVDVGPDGDGRTRKLVNPGAGLTEELAAAVSLTGVQYVAWTTSGPGKGHTVRLAERLPHGGWQPAQVIGRDEKQAKTSLSVSTTMGGAYVAWAGPGARGSTIIGALVRPGLPVRLHGVVGPHAVGDLGSRRFALDVDQQGRLIVAWTRLWGGEGAAGAALGRVDGNPSVTIPLFDVSGGRPPVALLRSAGEAVVVGSSRSPERGGSAIRSVSTD